ncbi:MAG: hypothetical protein ACOCWQ_04395 [Nanoarchaeota archaeon]
MKAQTATEYLVIVAVVLIMGLIVVSVVGGIPGIGSSVGQKMNREAATKSVGGSHVQNNGAGLTFRLINNEPSLIEISSIEVNDKLASLSCGAYPLALNMGGQDMQGGC